MTTTLFCPKCESEDVGSADMVLATAYGSWETDDAGNRVFVGIGDTNVHWDTQAPADVAVPCVCTNCGWSGSEAALVTAEELATP